MPGAQPLVYQYFRVFSRSKDAEHIDVNLIEDEIFKIEGKF